MHLRVVHALLKGETVEWSEEGRPHKIRFLNPELELINLHDPIPTHISAFGPRGRQLTAKLGVGWMAPARNAQVAGVAIAEMKGLAGGWPQSG